MIGLSHRFWRDTPLLMALAILIITGADWVPQVIAFSAIDEARIDISALIRLNDAFVHGARFGVDIIDPYGPLQFIARQLYWPGLYVPRMLGRILFAVALALLLSDVLRATGRNRITTAIAGALLVGWAVLTGLDSVHEFFPLFVLCAHLLQRKVTVATTVGVIAAALMALVKFQLFVLFVAALGTMTIVDVLERRKPWLLLIGCVSLVVFWLLAGQHVGDIPAWIWTSLELSSGFNDAMAYGFLEGWRALELAVLAGSAILLAVALWRATAIPGMRLRSLAVLAFVGVWSFIVWKHGIVRHDAHSAHAAGAFVLAFATVAAMLVARRGMTVLLMAALAVNFLMVRLHLGESAGPMGFARALARSVTSMIDAPGAVPTLAGRHAATVEQFRKMAGPLPTDLTLDQWPDNAAIAVFSGAEYRPRPMPYAFIAYTPAVSRRNAAFLEDSARAAQRIAFDIGTIDGRLPSFDDSLSWRTLLRWYEPEKVVGKELLLRRRNAQREERLVRVAEAEVRWNESRAVPSRGRAWIWATANIRKSVLGRVVNTLFKTPPITMSITTADGRTQPFRMVPDMMREGFVLSPAMVEQQDLLDVLASGATPPAGTDVVAIRFDMPASWAWLYQDSVHVTLDTLELSPALHESGLRIVPDTDPMTLLRRSVASSVFVRPMTVEGTKSALLAHAPMRLSMPVPANAAKLSLAYGLDPASYSAGKEGDGATFTVEALTPSGTVRVARRHLDPVRVADDRGSQVLVTDIPRGASKIFLVTDPGDKGNTAFDWSYWADVRLD